MPRNANGVYSLPEALFIAGTIIESSVMNSQLSDIGTALTNSLATTGVSFMTAPIRGSDGTQTAPQYTFNSQQGTGIRSSTGGTLFIAVGSVDQASFYASATASWEAYHRFLNTVSVSGTVVLTGGITGTVSINGGLVITGGLDIGFSATGSGPIANTIRIGDTNFFTDLVSAQDYASITFQDSTDSYMIYNHDTDNFVFVNNNVAVWEVESLGTSVFYTKVQLQEIGATVSEGSGDLAMYVEDNSGTSRVVYVDDNNNKTYMGGPGQWEQIAQTTVGTSVSGIQFSLTKRYSRIMVIGVSVSKNSATGTANLLLNVADDGATLASCRSTIANLGTNVFVSANMTIMLYTDTGFNCAWRWEINRADKTGAKMARHEGNRNTTFRYYGTTQIADTSAINFLSLAFEGGQNIQTGQVTVLGLLAR